MSKFIEIAESYLGANLADRKEMVKYYNEHCLWEVKDTKRYIMSLTDNWCGMFVSVVAHKAGFSGSVFPYGVSVEEMAKTARKRNQFSYGVKGASVGDLLLFDWNLSGKLNHIGIISAIGEDFIETIEGNYSNTVKRRHFKPSANFIAGVVYLEAPEEAVDARIEDLVARTMIGEFGNGEDRMNLLGADYDEVQKRINQIMK